MIPTSRKEAKELKTSYYDTGKLCKNGHYSKRFTNSGNCYKCGLKASNQIYHNIKKDPVKRKYQILQRVKQRALREGIEFDLTVDSVDWPTNCPIFGYELSYDLYDKDKSVSLDKHDPKKGYTKDNVIVMSMRANRAKWNLNIDEVKKLYEYLLSCKRS